MFLNQEWHQVLMFLVRVTLIPVARAGVGCRTVYIVLELY